MKIERFQKTMKRKDITLRLLAANIGCHYTTVAKWIENGEIPKARRPIVKELLALDRPTLERRTKRRSRAPF